MAYRELGVIEIREVLRRFCLGEGLRAIARGHGQRPEDGRQVRGRGGGRWPGAGVIRGRRTPTWRPCWPPSAPSGAAGPGRSPTGWRRIATQIAAWLGEGLRLTKIHRRLREQGVTVPYSSLHRFARAHLGFGAAHHDRPGGRAAARRGGRGRLRAARAVVRSCIEQRRRRVYGLLVTLCFSRYAFLAITLRQDLAGRPRRPRRAPGCSSAGS